MAKLRTGKRPSSKSTPKVGGRKRPGKSAPGLGNGLGPVNAERRNRAREIILGELRKARSISGACEEAEVSRTQFSKWKRDDPEWAEQVEEALAAGREALEDEAVRRGMKGYRKAVYHQGEIVGYERRYSDRLLETMLAANNPAKFRQNHKVELSGKVAHANVNLTLDDLKQLAAERGLPVEIFEK